MYRRHTNFALEAVEQTFNGTANKGQNVVATISRNGDLIHKCYLAVKMGSADNNSVNDIIEAHNLIKSVELEIGGQQIDKQYGDWMTIWNELSLPEDKQTGYESMVTANSGETLFIPLQFYFCTNPGLALPLIALQYHEVRIKVELGENVVLSASGSDVKLWVDYVYLDTDERRKMAQSSHEYLITQLQADDGNQLQVGATETTANKTARLNFNHPVKELVWVADEKSLGELGSKVELASLGQSATTKLTLNGHERAAPVKVGTFHMYNLTNTTLVSHMLTVVLC